MGLGHVVDRVARSAMEANSSVPLERAAGEALGSVAGRWRFMLRPFHGLYSESYDYQPRCACAFGCTADWYGWLVAAARCAGAPLRSLLWRKLVRSFVES